MSSETEKISVIIANYNHAKYIEQSIKSVLNQTYQNIEVIIVDDGSTDNSKDTISGIVEGLEPEKKRKVATTIFLPKNNGKWFALNTAIASATGKLITLCDADDVSNPLRIERQLMTMKENGSYHNLCGFFHCYSQEDMDKALLWKPNTTSPPFMPHYEVAQKVHFGKQTPGINHYYVGHDYEAHGASCLFYKQHWENGMKFLPGNMGLRCQKAEDSDFNTKMTLLLQRTSITKEPLYCYRRNTATNNAYLENL